MAGDSLSFVELRSDRRFQVWQYTVSMGLLLLRSTQSSDHSTQIDLLFRGTKYVRLPMILDGLDVRLGDRSDPDLLQPEVARCLTDRYAAWRVATTGDRTGLIIGGNAFTIETTDSWDAPSPLVQDYSINLT